MTDCIFCKIANHEMKSDPVWEDDQCMAFRDIRPQAPVHLLLIPKRHIAKLTDADSSDDQLLGHLLTTAARIADRESVAGGFRVVINNGAPAGQTVFHLHLHLLGGRNLTWPPG